MNILFKEKLRRAERAAEKGMGVICQEVEEISSQRKEYKERLKAVKTKLNKQRQKGAKTQG